MQALALDDVLGGDRYGESRDTIRRRIIAHKRSRRAAVGDRLTFLFEDRATVWYQTQEMLWVERITDLDAVRDELAVYNALLPSASELSATMLIEIVEQAHIRETLEALHGLDRHVALEVGAEARIAADFEPGRQTDEKLSAVQYVRFALPPAARAAAIAGAPLAITVDHPRYRHRVVLLEAVRASVVADLVDPAAGDAALRRVRDGE